MTVKFVVIEFVVIVKPQNQKFKLTYLSILSRKNNNKPRNIVFRITVTPFCALCFWNQPSNPNKLSWFCSLELPLPPSRQEFLTTEGFRDSQLVRQSWQKSDERHICYILQFIKSVFKSSLLMIIKANIYLQVFKHKAF